MQVAESSVEVLKQADIIFKVTEPLLDEVQMLQGTQTPLGFTDGFGFLHFRVYGLQGL